MASMSPGESAAPRSEPRSEGKADLAIKLPNFLGLSGMRERVALLGGRCEVQSYPKNDGDVGTGKRKGKGTKISIELPLAAEEIGRPIARQMSERKRAVNA